MDPNDHLDRDRGLLGESDRRYLLKAGDVEPGSQSERNIRSRVRTRLRNALLDFEILLEYLDERDREQVFQFDPEESLGEFAQTQTGITSTLAFLYDTAKKDDQPFEDWIERAVKQVESSSSEDVIELSPVEVTVEIDAPREIHLREVRRRFEKGDLTNISGIELFLLIWMEREGHGPGEGADLDEIFDAVADAAEHTWDLSEKFSSEATD